MLNGLVLASDGIGYGGLATAKDGFVQLNQVNLTICPPTLTNFSIESVLSSIELGIEELSSIDLSLTVDYLEYLLAIDSISYDLIMSSTICPPSLSSYDGPTLIESILTEPDINSVSFDIDIDSIEYLIDIDSIELKPSGTFEICQ